MCSPSSSAERRTSEALGSIDLPGEGLPPRGDLPGAERFIAEHVPILGPAASCFVRDLWRQAANQVHQESLLILEHARRYTPQRLERACQQALLYNLRGLAALQFILAEDLDHSPRSIDQDPEQLTFPFARIDCP
ncbi:MAG: hypothetical protein A2Y74_05550 [Actinobacteria bacterium RBG_13_63_9]|nr:MAG: hypothetical protein A2Y74_05550 [Actinobacteria bacterium RBG_13_63_9]